MRIRFSQVHGTRVPQRSVDVFFFRHGRLWVALFFQVIAHHLREGVEQQFEWFPIVRWFFVVVFFHFVDDRMDIFHDGLRMARVGKVELFSPGGHMYQDVSFPEYGIEKGIGFYLYPMYEFIGKVIFRSRENVPRDVDDSSVRNYPHVVVPIENLVNDGKVDENQIDFEPGRLDRGGKAEGILQVEKNRNHPSEKTPEQNIVHHQYRMTMTHEEEFFPFSQVLLEIDAIELIHGKP